MATDREICIAIPPGTRTKDLFGEPDNWIRLGEGSFGVVFTTHATPFALASLVPTLPPAGTYVVKSIKSGEEDPAVETAALLATAAIAAIPNVYACLRGDGSNYILMENAVGENLGTLLHRSRQVTPEGRAAHLVVKANAEIWILDLMNALRQMHSANLVHRDLKPGNIVVDGPRLKIVDLGGICFSGRSGRGGILPDCGLGHLGGTLHYVHPVFFLYVAQGAIDVPAVERIHDLWATGLVCMEILGSAYSLRARREGVDEEVSVTAGAASVIARLHGASTRGEWCVAFGKAVHYVKATSHRACKVFSFMEGSLRRVGERGALEVADTLKVLMRFMREDPVIAFADANPCLEEGPGVKEVPLPSRGEVEAWARWLGNIRRGLARVSTDCPPLPDGLHEDLVM